MQLRNKATKRVAFNNSSGDLRIRTIEFNRLCLNYVNQTVVHLRTNIISFTVTQRRKTRRALLISSIRTINMRNWSVQRRPLLWLNMRLQYDAHLFSS